MSELISPTGDAYYVDTATELALWADEFGLRRNWHEPDEQGVTARVVGHTLDNAFGSMGMPRLVPGYDPEATGASELRVVLTARRYEGDDDYSDHTAVVNLASLLAWASEPHRKAANR